MYILTSAGPGLEAGVTSPAAIFVDGWGQQQTAVGLQTGDQGEHFPVITLTMSAGPGGPQAGMPPPREQSKRLQQTQAQVDEVVDIMRVNVEKVLDRDQKISQLDDRAEALQVGASQFEASAGKLKRKYWWKNCKMWLILIGVIVVIIIIIVVWVVTSQKSSESPPAPPPSPAVTSTAAPVPSTPK